MNLTLLILFWILYIIYENELSLYSFLLASSFDVFFNYAANLDFMCHFCFDVFKFFNMNFILRGLCHFWKFLPFHLFFLNMVKYLYVLSINKKSFLSQHWICTCHNLIILNMWRKEIRIICYLERYTFYKIRTKKGHDAS